MCLSRLASKLSLFIYLRVGRGLVAITEKYFSPNYFDMALTGARADQEVLKELISKKLPNVYHHLQSIDIELSTISLNWFLAMFFDTVPFQVFQLLLNDLEFYSYIILQLDLTRRWHLETYVAYYFSEAEHIHNHAITRTGLLNLSKL